MKRNIYGLIIALVAVGFTSCLNDDMVNDQKYGLINLNANKIIEIPADASHTKNIVSLDEGVKEYVLEVRLAAENPASEDVVVGLEVESDTASLIKAVRTYLADQYPATGADSVPDEDILPFTLAGVSVPATVTIPKGARSVELPVSIDTHQLASETQFALVKIKSVDKSGYIISGNFGQLLFSLKVKHKYAGRYVLTGTMDNLPNLAAYKHITNLFNPDPYTCQLQTFDGSSLIFFEEQGWEDYIYPMMTAAGGYSGWGSFCPIFKFDTSGNVIAVTNYYGQPAGNTRSAVLDPAGVNKYDDATKSFTVSYYMVQPSVVAAPPHYRCHMVETYTFLEDL